VGYGGRAWFIIVGRPVLHHVRTEGEQEREWATNRREGRRGKGLYGEEKGVRSELRREAG